MSPAVQAVLIAASFLVAIPLVETQTERLDRWIGELYAKDRRKFHARVTLYWLGPGAVVSFVLKDSVPWVVTMGWFACVYAGASAWAAETPVEQEEQTGP